MVTGRDEQSLALAAAARRLGVHPSTLRRWADAGDIGVQLTPGGHRRFPVSEVERLLGSKVTKMDPTPVPRPDGVEQTLARTRQEIGHHDARWMHLSEQDLEEKRLLGRRLVGLMMQYLSAENGDGDTFLAEARAIGRLHGKSAIQDGLELSDALTATMFFRDRILESALLLPKSAQSRPEANTRVYRRINDFLNAVQLAIAEVFERDK
jgi:excisionase family DNA binding protein